MPINLVTMVVVQAMILVGLRLLMRRSKSYTTIDWPIALGIGVGLGVLMDVVLGAYGVFAYLPSGSAAAPIEPRQLSLGVLLFNALVSYSLASATVAMIVEKIVVAGEKEARWSITIGMTIFIGLIAVLFFPPSTIPMMFAWGVVIVGMGELGLHLCGKSGPFLEFAINRNWRPLLWFWLFSFFIGTMYEITNSLFPFWVWLPTSTVDSRSIKLLVAILGYMTLLHPMVVLYILFRRRK